MEISLIYGSHATLEEIIELHEKKGIEVVIEDGAITKIMQQ